MDEQDGTEDVSESIVTGDGTRITASRARPLARFEARQDGTLCGIIDYAVVPPDRDGPDPRRTVVILHTETFPPWGGHGVAGALTGWALDRIRSERGPGSLVPQCSFTRQFVSDHVEFADLVAPDEHRS